MDKGLIFEVVAKVLGQEKSMILRPVASGSRAATVHSTKPTPGGLAEENGSKWPQKGDFAWPSTFATTSFNKLKMVLVLLLCFSASANGEPWVNFLGNQSCAPHQRLEPKTLHELSTLVQCAAIAGHKIRVVGAGYSISDLVPTEGCLLSLKHLNRVLSIDASKSHVRVEAGITLKRLNEELAQHHLALPNQPAIDVVSLGGALATASHGTGQSGTLSSFVREIELVTADGKLHLLSATSDPEGFAAAKTSLGALGVIYAVTLQVTPLFHLFAEQEITSIDTILMQYQQLYTAHDFFQFSWNVSNGQVCVNCWDRCPQDKAEAMVCYKALNYYTPDATDKDLFSEVAIPMENLPKAIKAAQQFLDEYCKRGVRVADVVVRFAVADSETLLSPAAHYPVAYLTMSICSEDHSLAPDFYEKFEAVMLPYRGRPHWGKIHFLNREKATYLYGGNLEKFVRAKQRLDPHNIFSNTLIERLLGNHHEQTK